MKVFLIILAIAAYLAAGFVVDAVGSGLCGDYEAREEMSPILMITMFVWPMCIVVFALIYGLGPIWKKICKWAYDKKIKHRGKGDKK